MQNPSYKNQLDLRENEPVGAGGTVILYVGFSTKTCFVRGIVQLGTGLFSFKHSVFKSFLAEQKAAMFLRL